MCIRDSFKTVMIASGVEFQSNIFGNQRPEDFFDDITVVPVKKSLIFGGAIANHIVQVTIGVTGIKGGEVFQNGIKIFPVTVCLRPSGKKVRIIGVLPVDNMGRANDKIKAVSYTHLDVYKRQRQSFGII